MAHCPNCSPQPRNEQHTTDRLQNTVEPLLYTRNSMLAKCFKMECECMRCQEFISSIPTWKGHGKVLEHLSITHQPQLFFSPSLFFTSYCPDNVYLMFYCHPKLTFKYLSTTQTQQNLCAPWLSDCNLSINLGFCLSLAHIKSL